MDVPVPSDDVNESDPGESVIDEVMGRLCSLLLVLLGMLPVAMPPLLFNVVLMFPSPRIMLLLLSSSSTGVYFLYCGAVSNDAIIAAICASLDSRVEGASSSLF